MAQLSSRHSTHPCSTCSLSTSANGNFILLFIQAQNLAVVILAVIPLPLVSHSQLISRVGQLYSKTPPRTQLCLIPSTGTTFSNHGCFLGPCNTSQPASLLLPCFRSTANTRATVKPLKLKWHHVTSLLRYVRLLPISLRVEEWNIYKTRLLGSGPLLSPVLLCPRWPPWRPLTTQPYPCLGTCYSLGLPALTPGIHVAYHQTHPWLTISRTGTLHSGNSLALFCFVSLAFILSNSYIFKLHILFTVCLTLIPRIQVPCRQSF